MADLLATVESLLYASPVALSPREVLEAIWIGARIAPEVRDHTDAELSEEDDDLEEEDDEETEDEPSEETQPDRLGSGPEIALPHGEARAAGWRPQALTMPRPHQRGASLAEQAGIGRLALRRSHPDHQEFDLARTIEWSCRAGEPFLATRPRELESTHLVLLVDRGPTMSPWSDEAEHLEQLVRTAGRMMRRTVLGLNLASTPECLSVGGGIVELASVLRGGSDNLVLLWTDGLSPGFSKLGASLASLPETTRVAWVHPWPRDAWRRTPAGRLRLAPRGSTGARGAHVPVLAVSSDRHGWAAVAQLLRGGRPLGSPLLALPVEAVSAPTGSLPPKGDVAAWARHVVRVEAALHPDTVRLLGLLAAFPAERHPLDAPRALAAHVGLPASGFLLAEALTSGLLETVESGESDGKIWIAFRDADARRRCELFLDHADLNRIVELASTSELIPARSVEIDVLAAAADGDVEASATGLHLDTPEVPSASDHEASHEAGERVQEEGLVGDSSADETEVVADHPRRRIPSRRGSMSLPKRLQPALRFLEKDLLERAKIPSVEAGLRVAWEAEKKAGETGQGFDPWRRARVTQIAVAWVLSVVFVRTLEDRGLIDPRIAGPDERRLASARDREATFVQVAPFLGPREYLCAVFRELAHLPGAREVFDARHNPVWVLAPSSEGARALLDFFQQVDGATGAPLFTFRDTETRFLGDLYQDLSEAVRKRYALLQTPDFVEKFILEQTLAPAIEEFGLAAVKLIDPTCGSGHFLLGAFRDLLAAWKALAPATPVEELARRALDQVYGVDINPYAVAIARFRLVLAVLEAVGITRLDKAPALRPHVVVADSLLHRMKTQQLLLSGQLSMEEWSSWGDALFRLAEPGAVAEVLRQRYHAVVGNPPYITEKDAAKRKTYREMYESAAGKYALAAPFTERFFDLAVEGGFVGLINSNAWTKRDYGKTLIEKVLPRLDVHKVVDTSGCYLPGHGTPTLLLFGRNRRPSGADVVAVLGKRGEQEIPEGDPADAPVWAEIIARHDTPGFEGARISVETVSARESEHHPWILAGGGARPLLQWLEDACRTRLGATIDFAGFMAIMGVDDAFVRASHALRKVIATPAHIRWFATGTDIRDWHIEAGVLAAFFPYHKERGLLSAEALGSELRSLWPVRAILFARPVFGGKTYAEAGRKYFEYHQIPLERISSPNLIAYPFVSTHAHFVRTGPSYVFNKHAPIVRLSGDRTAPDYQGLLGYLNSSTVGFWCRLVMFPKGGDQVGDGARLSATQWNRHLEFAGNLLHQLPVPDFELLREHLIELVIAAEETVQAMAEHAADKVVAATLAETPSLAALRDARTQSLAERARLRGILVSLQEEMDWRVYGIFGLPTVTAPSVDAIRVPVEPNHRPFEVRLAREVDNDISASEWFRVHKRTAPADVGGPLADVYRQRLRLLDDPERGRQLRLLETPETKRRWSPPDDAKAFREAVRTWLLERIEAVFREQPTPELRTARQLALDLGRDAAVQAAYELLTEDSGVDLVKLVSELVDAEGVPFLAGFRYAETGMEKRATWEETWRLQRLEDEGKVEPELKRLGLEAIPVPDKYAKNDFLRHYWGLRGKLDVPKERFVTVPAGNNEDDPTPLCGWAGWDHLQTAQALAALYQRRKTDDGWTGGRLVPLLAGLAERVPWLLQWHNAPSDAYGGTKLGEFFRDFVAGEAHWLGVAVDFTASKPFGATDDLRTWTPPAAPKKKTLDPDELYAALVRWESDIDEDTDDDEDTEPPEGPTADELAIEAGATKALVNKALKVLLADGRVDKLDGRPSRYLATGGDE